MKSSQNQHSGINLLLNQKNILCTDLFDGPDGVGCVGLIEKEDGERDSVSGVVHGLLDGLVDQLVNLLLCDTAVSLHDDQISKLFRRSLLNGAATA